jgi:hypothetical protein
LKEKLMDTAVGNAHLKSTKIIQIILLTKTALYMSAAPMIIVIGSYPG